jgi:hypothetical protein
MSKPNDGGPFHSQLSYGDHEPKNGISVRTWLAGMAMQGFLSMYAGPDCEFPEPELCAIKCCLYADALLKELDK